LRDSLPIDMLLSALSFLVVAQSSSEVPEGLMNNPVCYRLVMHGNLYIYTYTCKKKLGTAATPMHPPC